MIASAATASFAGGTKSTLHGVFKSGGRSSSLSNHLNSNKGDCPWVNCSAGSFILANHSSSAVVRRNHSSIARTMPRMILPSTSSASFGCFSTSSSSLAIPRGSLFNSSFTSSSSSLLQRHATLFMRALQRTRRLYSSVAVESAPSIDLSPKMEGSAIFRNVAIVAHVDHGKTTLVDKLIKQTGNDVESERVMDHNVLEKERGITIMSKCTRVLWKDHVLNIVDTPGHQDFSGEVERILSLVDGVVLVVDASEGPMAQTKFVLMKALKQNLRPIVVFNKVDRESSRLANSEVLNEVFELFMNLEASDDQLEFPVFYASAREGWAVKDMKDERKNMSDLLDAIVSYVPAPKVKPSTDPFTLLVSNIEYDSFVGRVMRGRVYSGTAKVGDRVRVLAGIPPGDEASFRSTAEMIEAAGSRAGFDSSSSSSDSSSSSSTLPPPISTTPKAAPRPIKIVEEGRITKVFCYKNGLTRQDINAAVAGDIVSIAGVHGNVNDTICDVSVSQPIPALPLDPPTIAMTFAVHDSPLGGKEGKFLTSASIRDRLEKECENNVAISIRAEAESEKIEVHGRGELQLGILIETMRREGFELSVSPPRVLFKQDSQGRKLEPYEEVTVDVDQEYAGSIIDKIQLRGGEMLDFKNQTGKTRIVFLMPSRGLLGYANEMKTDTRGTAVLHSIFHSYRSFNTKVASSIRKGKLVSMSSGKATTYALDDLQVRGHLFVSPGDLVYQGMVVGENSRSGDMEVNPCKQKKATNVRTKMKDENAQIIPCRLFTLEEIISYVGESEVIDITPTRIRLRKLKIEP